MDLLCSRPISFTLLAGLALSATAFAADTDLDGIDDSIDNCTDFFNPHQLDSDDDLYGNACDGDLNNDGVVNATDYYILASQSSVGQVLEDLQA